MGWAHGINNNGREVGYAVEATCDFPACEAKIDRGIGHLCGDIDAVGNAGMEDEQYCGDYFCAAHTTYVPDASDPNETIQVCVTCAEKAPDWPEDADDYQPPVIDQSDAR